EEKATPEPRPSRANVPNSKVSQETETTPELDPKAPDPRSDKPQISSAVRVTSRHRNR
ncbi:hypothetical protein AVEN_116246-1, partial [Araneus ventricosus]